MQKGKNSKKRIGVLAMMLVLLLAVGATAGTTLAKYIYSAKIDSKQATVAKWGFTVTANTTDLFSEQYKASNIVAANTEGIDVQADAKVVAPGTSNATGEEGGQMTITINGSAEVDAKLTFDVSDFDTVWLSREVDCVETVSANTTSYTALKDEEDDTVSKYYPIVWTIGNGTNIYEINSTASDIKNAFAQQLQAALAEALENVDDVTVNAVETNGTAVIATIPAGTSLNNVQLTISWKWPFETKKAWITSEDCKEEDCEKPTSENGKCCEKGDCGCFYSTYNVEDTILGTLAANEAKKDPAEKKANTVYTTDGAKDYTIKMSEYTNTEENKTYNLTTKFVLKGTIEQVQNKNS